MWGSGNKVVKSVVAIADSCTGSKSSCDSPSSKGQNVRGRPRKSSTEEDRKLFAALQSGKTVDRNERQLKDLENLKAGACSKILPTFAYLPLEYIFTFILIGHTWFFHFRIAEKWRRL